MLLSAETERTEAREPSPTLDLVKERAIVALIHRAARLADDQKFLAWMDLFTEDGEYSAITHENLRHKGLRLFRDVGRVALHERVAFLMGLLKVPRGKTVHLVSNIEVSDGEGEESASAVSNFIIARTGELEHSQVHAVGRYVDCFERLPDGWRFKSRLVVVDSNLLPSHFTELL